MDDRILIKRLLAGDEQTFAQIVSSHAMSFLRLR